MRKQIHVILEGCMDGEAQRHTFEFDYLYDKNTRISALIKRCYREINAYYQFDKKIKPYLPIELLGNFYDVYDQIELSKMISYFELKEIHFHYISGIGEGYATHRGIKYRVNPNEAAHPPHIHAQYGGKTISISLLDFSFKGSFNNKKKEKEAVEFVKRHREDMINFFNANTNGIQMTYKEVLEYEKRKSQLA